jgi:hypothetical protein
MELRLFDRPIFALSRGGQEVALKEPPPSTVEFGASGTPIFAGQLYEEEYNSDLQGDKAITTYDKMRRSDGQVKAALLACKLPLMVARWDVAPATKDPFDVEVAGKVKDALFDGMLITWDSFLWQALLMFDYGHMVYEKVWELRDGLYQWKTLAPRLPTSIWRWLFTPAGVLDKIEQMAWKDDAFQTLTMPASKVLVFTHEREGENYRGISLLRAAYKHWWYKNVLYAIDGIAAERHGVGMAYFSYPDNATQQQKDAIDSVGQRLHTHERAYAALPDSIKLQLLGVTGQLHDTKGSIEHHDVQIVRSVLAQFINVGAREVGSYALSNDQSRFFLFALQAAGRNVCDTMNRHAIREMVDYNWDVHGRYPKLTVSGLDNPEITAFAGAIGTLASTGMLKPDDDTEAELRRMLKFPQRMDRAARPIGDRPVLPQQQPIEDPPAPEPTEEPPPPEQRASEPSQRFWRAARGTEMTMALDEIEDKLDDAESRFVEVVKPIQEKQIAKLVEVVSGYIKDEQFDRLGEIDVPFRSQVADAIDELLLELIDFGKAQVKAEKQKQGHELRAQEDEEEEVDKPKPDAFVHVRALAIASILANRLRAAMSWEALRQLRVGQLNPAALTATLTGLSDQELSKTAKFTTAEAFNMGREEQAKEDEDEIERVMSSAILDNHTCPYCEGEDGKEWPKGQEPAPPPYQDCEGRDRCRCVFVYTYKEEG